MGTYLILDISVWLDFNMVPTWLGSREALNNMRKKATYVLLRSTVLHGFTARWDLTFIQDIPGFISVEGIVFHSYVLWQRHDYYLCDEGMYVTRGLTIGVCYCFPGMFLN